MNIGVRIEHSGDDPNDHIEKMLADFKEDTRKPCQEAVNRLNARNLYCDQCKKPLSFAVVELPSEQEAIFSFAIGGGCDHVEDTIQKVFDEVNREFSSQD